MLQRTRAALQRVIKAAAGINTENHTPFDHGVIHRQPTGDAMNEQAGSAGQQGAPARQGRMKRYHNDYYAGALMLVIGLGAIYEGLRYKIGTLSKMGPGFFPVAIGAVLALLGVLIALGARSAAPAAEDKHLPAEWRGWFCIVDALLLALGGCGVAVVVFWWALKMQFPLFTWG
jgi:hypothetical protein